MLSPAQVRMARAALRIGVRDLALMADVTPATITRYETEKGGMQSGNLAAVQRVLEARGLRFTADNGVVAAETQG